MRVADDISGKMDDVGLDELLVTIRQEWAKLGPLIDLEAVQAGVENRGGLTLGRRRIEHSRLAVPFRPVLRLRLLARLWRGGLSA